MTLRYLLDTNVVSEPALQNPDPKLLTRLTVEAATCAIASPVWHELVCGVRRLPSGKRRIELEAYLSDVVRASFPVLPYDDSAAAWHAEERVRLEKLGTTPPFVDGQIAAVAFTNGLELITDNIKDFRRFRGIKVRSWR